MDFMEVCDPGTICKPLKNEAKLHKSMHAAACQTAALLINKSVDTSNVCESLLFFPLSHYAIVSRLGTESATQISRKSCDFPEIMFRYFKFQMLK